jgi:hypothetical protein
VLGLQPSDDFHFNDIIFKNGDVHILGSIKNPISTSLDDAYQLCYWKNGVKTIVENQHSTFPSTFGQKMQIFNSDLYITSSKNYDPLNYTYDLGYYKNGNYNFVSASKRFRQFFNDGTSLNMITTESTSNLLESYNIASNIFSSLPSFMNSSYYYSMIKDGSDTYVNVGGAYYKNNNLITLPNNNGGYVIYVDFKVLDENIYLIRQKDSEGIIGQKVFINNVEVQSIISNNTNDRFNSLTVVPQ